MQVEKRTAEQRREYMRAYHQARKEKQAKAPTKLRQVVTLIRDLPSPAVVAMREAWLKRKKYLEEVGGWPERRARHPESLEETLQRVK